MDELAHSGFVAIVGRPSSGKSTFLNTLCGYKVSIVSSVPQTTRRRIRGIHNEPGMQVVFIDTPGVHFSDKAFNQDLLGQAKEALRESDAVLLISDLSREFGDEDRAIVELVAPHLDRLVVVLNKKDLVEADTVAERQGQIAETLRPAAWIPISALDEKAVRETARAVGQLLPPGPQYYPPEYYTDQSQEFRVSELVREKVFQLLKEEIPHSSYVSVTALEYREPAERVNVRATVFVEKESQKGIVIGKKGAVIREIGMRARQDLERIFGMPTDLFLDVKVHDGWRRDPAFLKRMLKA